MSLHILRHKKWNVWNQDNEDIFTRDENEFMAKVEAEEKSARMNDMEKRIQMMKERNGLTAPQQHPVSDPADAIKNALYVESDIKEKGEISFAENEEHKSEIYEQKLKDIQSLKVPIWKLKPTELPAQPWYADDLSIKRNQNGKKLDDDEIEKREKRESQLKEMEDPLYKMKKAQEKQENPDSIASDLYLATAANAKELKSTIQNRMLNQPSDIQIPVHKHSYQQPVRRKELSDISSEESNHHKHHHKHHHRHHHKQQSTTNTVVSSIEESELYQQRKKKELEIQKLREERIKRETEERKRSTELLMRQVKRL